jgi:hypothetical protein
MKNFFLSFTVLLVTGIILISGNITRSQSVGDYRSSQSGNWNDISTWEQFDGTNWVTEYPSDGFPVIAGTSTSAKTTTTNAVHTILLPEDIQAGDLILIFWADASNSSTIPSLSGYTLLASSNSSTSSVYRRVWYRIADGTEGTSVSTNSFGDRSAHIVYRIKADTYTGTPFISSADNGTDTSPNPPNLSPGVGTQKFLWLATTLKAEVSTYGIPANFSNDLSIGTTGSSTSSQHSQVITAQRFLEAASLDVGAFSLGESATHTAYTVAIQGQTIYTPISYPQGSSGFPIVAGTNTSIQNDRLTSHPVSLPDNIQNGDLLLVFFADPTGDNPSTVTIPSGWTTLYNNNTSNIRSIVIYKVADGSEGSTIEFTTNAVTRSAHNSYRIAAGTYQGVPVAGTIATGSNTSPNPPNLISGFGTSKTLWIAASHSNRSTSTSGPATYTNLISIVTTGSTNTDYNPTMATAVKETETASEDPITFSISTSTNWSANTIAIQGGVKSNVSILSGHIVTVTTNQTADNVTVETGGTLVINDGVSLDISEDSELLILSSETLTLNGEALITGEGDFTLDDGAAIEIGSADGITLTDATGNIQVTGTRTYSSNANYVYIGGIGQVQGDGLPSTLNNLTINNANGVTLDADRTVNGTLNFVDGILYTGANTLFLGPDAVVTGEDEGKYLVGRISVTRDVDGTESAESFGGIGVSIDPGTENLGSTEIIRISGPDGVVSYEGNEGIARTWIINPANNPSEGNTVAVTFTWVEDDDISADPADYRVYHSPDGIDPWEEIFEGDIIAFDIRSITVAVGNFSYFTVGDGENAPLPVELSSFSAAIVNNTVNLSWTTETETMNFGFDVERKADNESEWMKVGFVEGHGNSNSPKEYSFNDKNLKSGAYSYRLKQIDTDGQYEYSKIVEVDISTPNEFSLGQNYPNPFNPSTKITFSVPVTSNVSLQIYNILGQKVMDAIMDQVYEAGVYEYNFDGTNLSSGIYLYTIQTDKFSQTKKMLMVK